jgi:chromosome segregation ATPase
MGERNRRIAPLFGSALLLGALAGVLAALVAPGAAHAQKGKIVCWKDHAGRVVGCGDKVPPEFQGSATKELDSRGVTRKQTESVEETNRRREKEQETAKSKVEDTRKAIDQQRQDRALMETYASEKEIDAKRDRDLQVLDLQIEQLHGALKNTNQRYNDAKGRADAAEKTKKPLPPALKDELSRVTEEKRRFEQSIENRTKEKEELRTRYSDYRRRFIELRSQQTAAKK